MNNSQKSDKPVPADSKAPIPYVDPKKFVQEAALDTVSAVATAVANPAALAHSTVRLVRAYQRGRFVEQLRAEWDALRSEGKIKEDYGATDQARAGMSDILESLEDANFDEEQLDLLRRLFLTAASEQLTNRDSPLPREYLAIGRELSTPEIQLLAQTHRFLPEWRKLVSKQGEHGLPYNSWVDLMRERTQLKHPTLIERNERKLAEKGLLMHPQRIGGAFDAATYRLTDLGFAFCEFLASYDKLRKPKASPATKPA